MVLSKSLKVEFFGQMREMSCADAIAHTLLRIVLLLGSSHRIERALSIGNFIFPTITSWRHYVPQLSRGARLELMQL